MVSDTNSVIHTTQTLTLADDGEGVHMMSRVSEVGELLLEVIMSCFFVSLKLYLMLMSIQYRLPEMLGCTCVCSTK